MGWQCMQHCARFFEGSNRKWILFLAFLPGIIVVAGCGGGSLSSQGENYQPFIPPTLVPTLPPTLTPVPTNTQAPVQTNPPGIAQEVVSASGCIDNLVFISDLTIPDGTSVVPGSTLDKQWEVENRGTCDWSTGYQIRLIDGPDLDAEVKQDLVSALAGTRVTIRMVFTAPEEPGSYHSAWQAFNPEGSSFGDPVFIDFIVE